MFIYLVFGVLGLSLIVLAFCFYGWFGYSDITKVCPACAEDIKTQATKCKHCGEIQPIEVNE